MKSAARIILAAVLLGFVAAGCGREPRDENESAAAATSTAVSVKTAVVTIQPFIETLAAIGAVTPRAGHVALLSAPAPTRVAQVFVSSGQQVSKGTTLVVLEQSTFRAAENSAAAAVNTARRNYDRARSLSEAGILPRKELEQATADLAKARADLVEARRASQLSVLHSPISGVVTRMDAVLGASVDANQPLVEVADPRAIDIVLNVTSTQAAAITPGVTVDLRAGQTAGGERLGVGTVIDIAGKVDSASRSVAVRVRAPTTRRPLRIGETVYGEIALALRASAVTVPNDALVPEGDGFKVFVVDAAGIVHARGVTVGSRTETTAEIKAGLTGGEKIVTYGAYGLEDGAKVAAMKK